MEISRRPLVIFGILICLLFLDSTASAASMVRPARNDVSNTADALKYLEELDSYYSNIARPRIIRNDNEFLIDDEIPEIETALQLLRLEIIDRIYSKHHRPRFGKRGGLYQILRDRVQDDPELDEWRTKYLAQR